MFTTQRKLLCKFTDAERDERAQLLASLLVECEEVDESRKDRAKGFRDKLKTIRKRIKETVEQVRAGGEERDVECRVFMNQPVAGTKQTVRGDTGEIVSESAMSEAEMQENLFKPGELENMFGQGPAPAEDAAPKDELFDDAVRIVVEFGRASAALLQRRLRIGYGRAAAIIDAMEAAGIVGPENGKSREILKPPDVVDPGPKQEGEQPEAGV